MRHVSASRAAGSTRDALASRDRRDSRFGSASLRAPRERAREPTCAPRADFARKKAKRFRALTRRQATVGVDVAHTRARDRFGHTRQTRGRRDARSARAGPIDGETRGGTRDVRRSAVLISKRSRARRFPEKKGIIVVARRGVARPRREKAGFFDGKKQTMRATFSNSRRVRTRRRSARTVSSTRTSATCSPRSPKRRASPAQSQRRTPSPTSSLTSSLALSLTLSLTLSPSLSPTSSLIAGEHRRRYGHVARLELLRRAVRDGDDLRRIP